MVVSDEYKFDLSKSIIAIAEAFIVSFVISAAWSWEKLKCIYSRVFVFRAKFFFLASANHEHTFDVFLIKFIVVVQILK